MRRGVCVKCQGTTIYVVPGKAGRFGGYEDLRVGDGGSYFLVCGACGYAERYIDPDALAAVHRSGKRLPPPAPTA